MKGRGGASRRRAGSAPAPGLGEDELVARVTREGGRILGRPLGAGEAGKLWAYAKLLSHWNSVARLVGSGRLDWIVDNVVLDSLLFGLVVPEGARRLMDLGSGGGVPGIPLALVWPDVEVVLVEARERRVSFLRTAIRELGLGNVRCVGARVEVLDPEDLGGRVDAVVARCAGAVADVVAQGARFGAPGAVMVVSGPPVGRSARSAREAAAGSPARRTRVVVLPGVGGRTERQFIVVEI